MPPGLTFDDERHFYALDGLPLPSVTSIVKAAGLGTDYSNVPPEILEKARRRGIWLHDAYERIARGEDVGETPPDYAGYVDGCRRFVDDTHYQCIRAEQSVYHPQWLYAGRYDQKGWLAGERTGVDFKNVAQVDHVYTAVQLAAYREADAKIFPDEEMTRIAAVQLFPNGTYRLHEYDYAEPWRIFCYALAIKRFKQKRGYRK